MVSSSFWTGHFAFVMRLLNRAFAAAAIFAKKRQTFIKLI
jgi:hypothetical protein